jgi:hypothetical protein
MNDNLLGHVQVQEDQTASKYLTSTDFKNTFLNYVVDMFLRSDCEGSNFDQLHK